MRDKICGFLKNQRVNLWALLLFALYLLLLVWVVIFKAKFELPYVRAQRSVNLIPFYFPESGFGLSFDAVANFFVFIPFGFYLCMGKIKLWRAALCGLALSLVFELTQLVFAIGVVDVTDLITNTSGALLGAGLYVLLLRLCRRKSDGAALQEVRLDKALRIIATVVTSLAYTIFLLLFAHDAF